MFDGVLSKLVTETPGGIGAVIMGYDGIAVHTHIASKESIDMESLGMEYSFVLTQIRKAAMSAEMGVMQETVVRGDKVGVLFRALTEDYFLAVALHTKGNYGKARFLMRLAAPKLTADF